MHTVWNVRTFEHLHCIRLRNKGESSRKPWIRISFQSEISVLWVRILWTISEDIFCSLWDQFRVSGKILISNTALHCSLLKKSVNLMRSFYDPVFIWIWIIIHRTFFYLTTKTKNQKSISTRIGAYFMKMENRFPLKVDGFYQVIHTAKVHLTSIWVFCKEGLQVISIIYTVYATFSR